MAKELAEDPVTFSNHDREILREFYVCFDRPAFRERFEHESDLDALIEALDDTIAAISTGVKRIRSGLEFGNRVECKAYFDDQTLRSKFDEVVDILSAAKLLYAQAQSAGYFFDMSQIGRRGIAFHANYSKEANRVAVIIDEARNRFLEIINGIYRNMDKADFKYLKTPEYSEQRAGLLELKAEAPKSKFRFLTILEVLELRPNFFGISINLNELLKRISGAGTK